MQLVSGLRVRQAFQPNMPPVGSGVSSTSPLGENAARDRHLGDGAAEDEDGAEATASVVCRMASESVMPGLQYSAMP